MGASSNRGMRPACFPYGAVRRIRFGGSSDGTCRNLSPAPRAHLNEVRGQKARTGGFSTSILGGAAGPSAADPADGKPGATANFPAGLRSGGFRYGPSTTDLARAHPRLADGPEGPVVPSDPGQFPDTPTGFQPPAPAADELPATSAPPGPQRSFPSSLAMKKLHILHLEDRAADAYLVQQSLEAGGIEADIAVVETEPAFRQAIGRAAPDLILLDNGVPSFGGSAALEIARASCPQTPVIFVTGAADEKRTLAGLRVRATDIVAKGDIAQLLHAVRQALETHPPADDRARLERHHRGMQRLVAAVQQLSMARDLDTVMAIVRTAARELTGADGATFVLRDTDKCHYADEDAISPLWKGKRFPLNACISGWAMLNRQHVVIPDIYVDPRIPIDAYRPTFVKSLVMVPIRTESPIGAIGNYWAQRHEATPGEIELLQALANTTSVALENVRLYAELEQRVQDRTVQLAAANQELEAFSYSVSHDLQSPLGVVVSYAQLLADSSGERLTEKENRFLHHIRTEAWRMSELIRDLLRLAQVARTELHAERVDLAALAREEILRLRTADPERAADVAIAERLEAHCDPGLMRVVLENLLANAWKYSSKRARSVIEFGALTPPGQPRTFFVKDNGAGFDMKYADKLFAAFQRLHRTEDFKGTGVGLATVARVIHKHGGRIWAEAAVDQGATFYFTLG